MSTISRYIIANMATGEIVRTVVCPDDQAAQQVMAGELMLPSNEAEPDTHYVQAYNLIAYTPEQYEARQARPHYEAEWDNATMDWIVTASLDSVKAVKNEEINVARLAANRTTFPYAGKLIACDELSRSDIEGTNGQVLLTGNFPTGWPGGWKTVDNSYVAIATLADWTAFYTAMVQQGSLNFAQAQALKTQLAAATTVEEIEAIKWTNA